MISAQTGEPEKVGRDDCVGVQTHQLDHFEKAEKILHMVATSS